MAEQPTQADYYGDTRETVLGTVLGWAVIDHHGGPLVEEFFDGPTARDNAESEMRRLDHPEHPTRSVAAVVEVSD